MRPPSVWRWPHRYSEPCLHTINHNIYPLRNRTGELATVPHKLTQVNCTYLTLLRQLHWLSVQHRITYKLAVLTYKVQTTSKPGYLSHHITWQCGLDSTLDHDQSIVWTVCQYNICQVWIPLFCSSHLELSTKNSYWQQLTSKSRLKIFLFFSSIQLTLTLSAASASEVTT